MSIISKKGVCKVLKQTYRRGYELVPQGELLTLNGKTWAIQCETMDLPVEAALQIVENAGYMPVEAILIQAGAPNQILMAEAAAERTGFFQNESEEYLTMRKIPVIFKERWQLYQTERGEVYGFDMELMQMIDFKTAEPEASMASGGCMGAWHWGGMVVFIAPGRFSKEDAEKLCHIASLDWEKQQDHDDPAANMSLFDENADEPLMERTE